MFPAGINPFRLCFLVLSNYKDETITQLLTVGRFPLIVEVAFVLSSCISTTRTSTSGGDLRGSIDDDGDGDD